MSPNIEKRLEVLGIELEMPPAAVANYTPVHIVGDLLYVSGQLPMEAGNVRYEGKLGEGLTVEEGQAAARLCAINVLSQVKAKLLDLDRIQCCVRLGGFIASSANFSDHAIVMNGASDLIVEVMLEKGRHCRAAIGCSSLPLNAAVEVEALFQIIE